VCDGITYRGPTITLAEIFDELCSNGRSNKEAYAELRQAIKDGALVLIDLHDEPLSDDELHSAALGLLDAELTKRPTFGAVPWGHPDYFSKGVVTLRAQFEMVFGLTAEAETSIGNKPASDKQIREAIRAEYNRADAAKERPPNINELWRRIKPLLTAQGFEVSGNRIETIGEEKEFKSRRGLVGKYTRH
jgi:hypothetical protein